MHLDAALPNKVLRSCRLRALRFFLPINCNHIISVTMRLRRRQSVWIGKERGKSDHDVFVRQVGDGPIINTVHPLPELLISVCSKKMEVDSGVGSCLRTRKNLFPPSHTYVRLPSLPAKRVIIFQILSGAVFSAGIGYTFFRPSLVNEATRYPPPAGPEKDPK